MNIEIDINLLITITLAILSAFVIRAIWNYFCYYRVSRGTFTKYAGNDFYNEGRSKSGSSFPRPTTGDQ